MPASSPSRAFWSTHSTASPRAATLPSPTASATASPSETPADSPGPTPTAPPTPEPGWGDSNGDGVVEVDEVITAVAVSLGGLAASTCSLADVDGDGAVTGDELISGTNSALRGCLDETAAGTGGATRFLSGRSTGACGAALPQLPRDLPGQVLGTDGVVDSLGPMAAGGAPCPVVGTLPHGSKAARVALIGLLRFMPSRPPGWNFASISGRALPSPGHRTSGGGHWRAAAAMALVSGKWCSGRSSAVPCSSA